MPTSHAGLQITASEWEASLELTRKALLNRSIGLRDQRERFHLASLGLPVLGVDVAAIRPDGRNLDPRDSLVLDIFGLFTDRFGHRVDDRGRGSRIGAPTPVE